MRAVNNGGQATLTISGTNIQIPLGPSAAAVATSTSNHSTPQSTNVQQNSNQNQNNNQQQQQQQNTILTIPSGGGNAIQIPTNTFSTAGQFVNSDK